MANLLGSVVARRQGRIGRITLNRPGELNALTLEMIHAITVALETWRCDPAVHAVVIESSSERAFCAGGDVRTVRDDLLAERFQSVEAFFVQEYALNRIIARYDKPYIALIDGICMGGGLGLSVHGCVRVASEHASFAMPETQLGLFPDVGGSFFLPRLRGSYGMYLALTGTRVGGPDACWIGLATHFVPRPKLATLADSLAENGVGVLASLAEPPLPLDMPTVKEQVNSVFSQDSIAAITSSLQTIDAPWAAASLSAIKSASPSALQWTFDLLRSGASWTFEQCQRAELLLTRRACAHPDFAEGVRANIVDKDRKPNWQPLAN